MLQHTDITHALISSTLYVYSHGPHLILSTLISILHYINFFGNYDYLVLQSLTILWLDSICTEATPGQMSLKGPEPLHYQLVMDGLMSLQILESRIGLMNLMTKQIGHLGMRPIQNGWTHMTSRFFITMSSDATLLVEHV